MFVFPIRENTRNLPENIKTIFLHGIYLYLQHMGNFEVLKFKGCTIVFVGCYL